METESGTTQRLPEFLAFSVAVVGLVTVGVGWLERSDKPWETPPSLTRAIVSLALSGSAIAMEAIPIPRSRPRMRLTIALGLSTVLAAAALLVWIAIALHSYQQVSV